MFVILSCVCDLTAMITDMEVATP